jgi:hypothetical protein
LSVIHFATIIKDPPSGKSGQFFGSKHEKPAAKSQRLEFFIVWMGKLQFIGNRGSLESGNAETPVIVCGYDYGVGVFAGPWRYARLRLL